MICCSFNGNIYNRFLFKRFAKCQLIVYREVSKIRVARVYYWTGDLPDKNYGGERRQKEKGKRKRNDKTPTEKGK